MGGDWALEEEGFVMGMAWARLLPACTRGFLAELSNVWKDSGGAASS